MRHATKQKFVCSNYFHCMTRSWSWAMTIISIFSMNWMFEPTQGWTLICRGVWHVDIFSQFIQIYHERNPIYSVKNKNGSQFRNFAFPISCWVVEFEKVFEKLWLEWLKACDTSRTNPIIFLYLFFTSASWIQRFFSKQFYSLYQCGIRIVFEFDTFSINNKLIGHRNYSI